MTKYPKVKVRLGALSGPDGNAYVILGNVRRALLNAGVSKDDVDAYHADATSADYTHLLQVSHDWVDLKFR